MHGSTQVMPGGWRDTLGFLGGSMATLAVSTWWSSRKAPASADPLRAAAGLLILGCVLLFGAGLYQAAQKRRLRKGLLYPRRAGAVISAGLGLAYPLLLAAGGRTLNGDLAPFGLLALFFLLPWVLSRAQWTTTPPGVAPSDSRGRPGVAQTAQKAKARRL